MYFYPNTTLGFLNDSDSFDLYNNIDKWYEELESQFTVREISWWGENLSIAEVLNKNASVEKLNECFKSNINYFDVKNLATWDDSTSFNTKILNSCWKNWQISQSLLSKYQKIAISTYNKWLIKASTKVDNIYKISRIWLYSDWIKENSPFDLVTDIEEINDIVFEKELTYNWQQWYDLSQKVDDLLYWDNSSANLIPSSKASSSKQITNFPTGDFINLSNCQFDIFLPPVAIPLSPKVSAFIKPSKMKTFLYIPNASIL